MRILVCKDYESMSQKAAQIILNQVTLKPNSVLGLATGSTPIGMYKNLVDMYKNGVVNFSDITTFNLDEYYKLPITNDQSYHYFMQENLFNHININPANIHIPNGMADNIEKECEDYENSIKDAGGIDIQVLGIGRNAHIGFNEPTTSFEKGTHLVDLTPSTIEANARFFKSENEVPKKAVTMGTGSIFKARKIVMLAYGEDKADAIYNTVHGKITPKIPASILQLHGDVVLILDEAAASKLNPSDYLN